MKHLPKDRIREIIDVVPISQTALAKVAGCSKGLVTQWLTGQAKTINMRHALRIEARTGYSAHWIVYGTEPKRIDLATKRVMEVMAQASQEQRDRIATVVESLKDWR